MRGVNKVILVGTFGKDPEIKNLPQGGAAGNFSLATNESWIDKNTNEKKEQTEWHRVVVYQRLAEIVGQYMKKGSKVYVEGKLTTRKWTDKDGVERYTTEIVANEVQMLDSQGQQSGGQQQAPAYQAPQQAAPQQQAPQGSYQQPQQQPAPAYQAPQQQAPAQQQPAYQQPQQQTAPQQQPPADFDDDIPF